MKITKEWIESQNACADGAKWGIKTVGKGMELDDLLPKFKRADWLIWTLDKSGECSTRQLVKLACVCARRALRFVPDGEERPKRAILAAEKWAKKPTAEAAAEAARAAEAAEPARAARASRAE